MIEIICKIGNINTTVIVDINISQIELYKYATFTSNNHKAIIWRFVGQSDWNMYKL